LASGLAIVCYETKDKILSIKLGILQKFATGQIVLIFMTYLYHSSSIPA